MSLAEWRKKRLEAKNIKFLYNFSNIENLPSIIKNGILPKNFVNRSCIKTSSFAEESVQERRHNKTVKLSDKSQVNLHDLVPLYFTPKTPTLYARKDLQSKIFFVEISVSLIYEEANNFSFTDGNAGSDSTQFFRNLNDISSLPLEVINAEYWNNFEDGRRKRCAEFLVYPKVDAKYINKFVVINNEALSICKDIIRGESNCNIPIDIDLNFFPHLKMGW